MKIGDILWWETQNLRTPPSQKVTNGAHFVLLTSSNGSWYTNCPEQICFGASGPLAVVMDGLHSSALINIAALRIMQMIWIIVIWNILMLLLDNFMANMWKKNCWKYLFFVNSNSKGIMVSQNMFTYFWLFVCLAKFYSIDRLILKIEPVLYSFL